MNFYNDKTWAHYSVIEPEYLDKTFNILYSYVTIENQILLFGSVVDHDYSSDNIEQDFGIQLLINDGK